MPLRYVPFLLLVCYVAQAQPSPVTSAVHPLMVQFEADKGSLERFYVIPNSPERRERMQRFYTDYQQRLAALDFDRMNTDSRVDYLLFRRDMDTQQRMLAQEADEMAQIATWFPFADKIYAAEKTRRRGATLDAPKLAAELTDVAKQLAATRQLVERSGSLTPNLARRANRTALGLKKALESVWAFYNDYDPNFTWWVKTPYEQLNSALNDYATLFGQRAKRTTASGAKPDSSGIVGVAVGREELLRQLQYDMIPYSPEELVEIANKEFAWCDRELLKASREMGFGDNWRAAQEKVKNSYVPVGRQPEMIMRLYNESIDFLKKNDLITIPPIAEETWRMEMMSPERQRIAPFFLGGETLLISYPTSTMEQADKLMSMRGNNPHFSRSTVHHELIAGHHLQGFMNNRYKTYRQFDTPFWTEGWALYWEFLLWDKGFPQSPEDRIGMLFWRMHRCARIIFSLNYHLGRWSPQQCIDFLVDRVGHERSTAEGEVRRSFTGGYPPLYQLAYMTGAFQFWALRNELLRSRKMTEKQFHDAVMQMNALPVEMIRAILLDQKLPKDFKTNWRFYDLGAGNVGR